MARTMQKALCAALLVAAPLAADAVTIYSQVPLADATSTSMAPGANYTGSAAYDPTVLQAPAPPNVTSRELTITLAPTAQGMEGLGRLQNGTMLGFSIEMSVVNQVMGKNQQFINVPFLNLMSQVAERAGAVHVRVGGNTQESARWVDHLDDGRILEKDKENTSNPTQTPPLDYTDDFLFLLANISSLVNVKWYLGIPFFNTTPFDLTIVDRATPILGNNIIAFQASNEPDLYAGHGHRNQSYSQYDYFGEWSDLLTQLKQTPLGDANGMLLGPSVSGTWSPESIIDTGFLDTYQAQMYAFTVEHYQIDNCFPQYGIGTFHDPQETFPQFLCHTCPLSGREIVKPYLNSSQISLQRNLPYIMFETNTASCGGFPGISDSFGIALWGLDYGLQMAHSNFTGALFHVGGQNVYYNPFTASPTNQSNFHEWTVGPLYYTVLVAAEIFGSTNQSQVIDVSSADNDYAPTYAIYENGALARVALFNYATDPSGGSDVNFTIVADNMPATVNVKYLSAPSVSAKDNIMWANQTFGAKQQADGRLRGDLNVVQVACTQGKSCTINVPAPSFALVFLSDAPFGKADEPAVATYSTTARTNTRNTATIEASVLATANGMNGKTRLSGSTSSGSKKNAGRATAVMVGLPTLAIALVGTWVARWAVSA